MVDSGNGNGGRVKMEWLQASIEKMDKQLDQLAHDVGAIRECLAAMPSQYVTAQEHARLMGLVDTKVGRLEFQEGVKELEASIKGTYKVFGLVAAVVGFVVGMLDKIVGLFS